VRLPRRVGRILTDPAHEWPVIAREETDPGRLYGTHVAILAAIPSLAILTGLAISGGRYLGNAGIATAVTAAMVSYAMALALPFAAALAIAALAPRFKSDGGMTEALKLTAYALTPFWLSGVFYVFVSLSWLVVSGGLYAVYLFFTGLSPVMGTPLDQRVPFTLVALITMLALNIALSWIVETVRLPYYGF
jgi:hypothetical protein